MKKVALFSLFVVSLFFVGATYFHPLTSSIPIKAESQQDVAVDLSSQKDFFEYSLSSVGEQSLDQVRTNVRSDAAEQTSINVSIALFDTYLAYKRALTNLEPLGATSLSVLELQRINDEILALQRQFFTDEQIKQLFDEENRLRQLSVDKLVIKENTLDTVDQKLRLEELLIAQPSHIQESERNNALTLQLVNTSQLSSQQKYLARVELVGEQGAQRLQELDDKRAAFKTSLDHYLAQRSDILNTPGLGPEAIQQEITTLRNQSFEPHQQRRIEALERIHDEQSKN